MLHHPLLMGYSYEIVQPACSLLGAGEVEVEVTLIRGLPRPTDRNFERVDLLVALTVVSPVRNLVSIFDCEVDIRD